MKISNQNIVKREYKRPAIEEVVIDLSITLSSPSTGGEGPIDPDDPDFPDNVGDVQSINYGSESYKQVENPFGGSRPAY
jgi:hypothetical protein